MPAIQLARLRLEVAELSEHFQNPDHFANRLNHLLEFYADRTRRPKLKGAPPPTLKSYTIPQPVFRQIVLELSTFAIEAPEATLAIIDRCWAEPVYEFRLLAIHLLGLISPKPPTVVLNRVHHWLDESIEDADIYLIFDVGLVRFRKEQPSSFVEMIETFLSAGETKDIVFGLLGLLSLINADSFDNLPTAFRLIKPAIELNKKQFRPYLIKLIRQLSSLSAQETYFTLNTVLDNSPNKELFWLIRNSLEFFPSEQKTGLKTRLRKKR